MHRSIRLTAAAAVAAAASLTAASTAGAAGTPSSSSSAVRPCTIDNVSFYYGGYSAGLGQRNFAVTLLAHDGITCSLSDTPLITLAGPESQTTPIPVQILGRGGTLILRPDSPLHATLSYSAPDSPQHTLFVDTLTLAMPDGTSRTSYFLSPGDTAIYNGGVFITSWTTGIGLGEGEESF
jgi:uncharacterized protein DUF4232